MSSLVSHGLSRSDIEGVASFISRLRLQDDIDCLFSILEAHGPIVLVGGTIRDVVIKRRSPRDLDLIIDTPRINFDDDLKEFNYKKNSFGGYKVKFDTIEIDFWSIHSNWAFKEGILPLTKKNISKGCFFNIDSISLNLSSYEWDGLLFEGLTSKQLDIVLDDHAVQQNPTKTLNVLRAFILKNEYSLNFSHRVNDYIYEWLNETKSPFHELCKVEKIHYQNSKTKELNEAINSICDYAADLDSHANLRHFIEGMRFDSNSDNHWHFEHPLHVMEPHPRF